MTKLPLWFIFALVAALFSGLNNFFKKVSAENKGDSRVVAFYFNLFSTLFAFMAMLFFAHSSDFNLNKTFFIIISAVALANVINIVFKVRGLKFLASSTMFISLRFFMVTALFLVEIFIFHSSFAFKDIIGIIIGFIALFFLIESDSNKKQDFKKGFLAVGACVVAVTVISTLKKSVALDNYNQFVYYFFVFLFSFLMSSLINFKIIKNKSIFSNTNGAIFYPALQALMNFIGQVFGFLALVYGANLAIYAKVSSTSLFVPIILSAIFYKEKITGKRIIAFILAMISLMLFV